MKQALVANAREVALKYTDAEGKEDWVHAAEQLRMVRTLAIRPSAAWVASP